MREGAQAGRAARGRARRAPAGEAPAPVSEMARLAARLRPDRLVVDGVRSEDDAYWTLMAAALHPGSIVTVECPEDALRRLEALCSGPGAGFTPANVRRLVAGAVDGVARVGRAGGGRTVVGEVVVPGRGGRR